MKPLILYTPEQVMQLMQEGPKWDKTKRIAKRAGKSTWSGAKKAGRWVKKLYGF